MAKTAWIESTPNAFVRIGYSDASVYGEANFYFTLDKANAERLAFALCAHLDDDKLALAEDDGYLAPACRTCSREHCPDDWAGRVDDAVAAGDENHTVESAMLEDEADCIAFRPGIGHWHAGLDCDGGLSEADLGILDFGDF